MKKFIFAVMALMLSGTALAQLSGNAAVTSDYRFRGISQTQNALAVQGGIDYAAASGLYVGNWNSSISSQLYPGAAGMESDIYAGFKTEILKGVTLDVGTMNYFYPRASTATGGKFDTNEVYAGVAVGAVSAKVSQSLGDYFGTVNSQGSRYYQLDANLPIASKVTAQAHVGRTDVANNSASNYTDYKVGATYDLQGWQLGAHYYTNTGYANTFEAANTVNGQRLFKNAVVVSVGKSF